MFVELLGGSLDDIIEVNFYPFCLNWWADNYVSTPVVPSANGPAAAYLKFRRLSFVCELY